MNIVYIGDEVRHIHEQGLEQAVVWGNEVLLMTTMGEQESHAMFTTPEDGLPVTGFGGAKIVYCKFDVSGDCWFIQGFDIKCDLSRFDVEHAMDMADLLYGPWQRPYTEADLKRRGLL